MHNVTHVELKDKILTTADGRQVAVVTVEVFTEDALGRSSALPEEINLFAIDSNPKRLWL